MAITDFNGKVALITGGASGIGLGIARRLVERGAHAILADFRQDHLDEAIAGFKAAGKDSRVEPLLLDVTNRDAMEAAAREIESRHGGIDILVNNAGVGLEGMLRDARYADWDFGLGVNLGGVINGIVTFVPRMLARGKGGHVVNTASLAALVRMPSQYGIYVTSKAAVVALSESLRLDLAPDRIGVTVLCPGFVKSNIHEAAQNRPERFRQGSGFGDSEQHLSQRELGADWMEPEEVGDMVINAIENNKPFIVTHGNFREQMQTRFDTIMAATPPAPEPQE